MEANVENLDEAELQLAIEIHSKAALTACHVYIVLISQASHSNRSARIHSYLNDVDRPTTLVFKPAEIRRSRLRAKTCLSSKKS
jgi:hypothetical protein